VIRASRQKPRIFFHRNLFGHALFFGGKSSLCPYYALAWRMNLGRDALVSRRRCALVFLAKGKTSHDGGAIFAEKQSTETPPRSSSAYLASSAVNSSEKIYFAFPLKRGNVNRVRRSRACSLKWRRGKRPGRQGLRMKAKGGRLTDEGGNQNSKLCTLHFALKRRRQPQFSPCRLKLVQASTSQYK
jgi:hypothetical protein